MDINENFTLNRATKIRSNAGDARVLVSAVEAIIADWQDDGAINGNHGIGNADEIIAMIEQNAQLIASLDESKVNVSDIANDLVTADSLKPLSAEMGVELKTLIDAITATGGASSESEIAQHNASSAAHADIRELINVIKQKLDNVEEGANNYVLPIASNETLGGVKQGSGVSIDSDGVLSTNELPYMSNTDFLNVFS